MTTWLVFLTLGFSVSTQNNHPLHWTTRVVDYEVNANAPNMQVGEALDAIHRAVKSWIDVDCSDFRFIESGTTTETDTVLTNGQFDGHNRVVWINDSRWQYGRFVLGITTPVFNGLGEISEADISFNGYSAAWSTDGSLTDVESVAVHELGHFTGLQHVLDGENMSDPPTMSPVVDPELRTRTLTSDDEQGLCFLYPTGRYNCQYQGDCPRVIEKDNSGHESYAGQLKCAAGVCGDLGPVVADDRPAGGSKPLTTSTACTGSACKKKGCSAGAPGPLGAVMLLYLLFRRTQR